MDKITTLDDVVQNEVDMYAGHGTGGKLYSVNDHQRQIYSVIVIPDDPKDRPAWVLVMAHIVDNHIVVDEDRTDKPLVEALMINGGIPREQIVLAYAGETLQESNP